MGIKTTLNKISEVKEKAALIVRSSFNKSNKAVIISDQIGNFDKLKKPKIKSRKAKYWKNYASIKKRRAPLRLKKNIFGYKQSVLKIFRRRKIINNIVYKYLTTRHKNRTPIVNYIWSAKKASRPIIKTEIRNYMIRQPPFPIKYAVKPVFNNGKQTVHFWNAATDMFSTKLSNKKTTPVSGSVSRNFKRTARRAFASMKLFALADALKNITFNCLFKRLLCGLKIKLSIKEVFLLWKLIRQYIKKNSFYQFKKNDLAFCFWSGSKNVITASKQIVGISGSFRLQRWMNLSYIEQISKLREILTMRTKNTVSFSPTKSLLSTTQHITPFVVKHARSLDKELYWNLGRRARRRWIVWSRWKYYRFLWGIFCNCHFEQKKKFIFLTIITTWVSRMLNLSNSVEANFALMGSNYSDQIVSQWYRILYTYAMRQYSLYILPFQRTLLTSAFSSIGPDWVVLQNHPLHYLKLSEYNFSHNSSISNISFNTYSELKKQLLTNWLPNWKIIKKSFHKKNGSISKYVPLNTSQSSQFYCQPYFAKRWKVFSTNAFRQFLKPSLVLTNKLLKIMKKGGSQMFNLSIFVKWLINAVNSKQNGKILKFHNKGKNLHGKKKDSAITYARAFRNSARKFLIPLIKQYKKSIIKGYITKKDFPKTKDYSRKIRKMALNYNRCQHSRVYYNSEGSVSEMVNYSFYKLLKWLKTTAKFRGYARSKLFNRSRKKWVYRHNNVNWKYRRVNSKI